MHKLFQNFFFYQKMVYSNFLLTIFVLLSIQSVACATSDLPRKSATPRPPRLFRVDLDLAPRDRWKPVLEAFNGSDLIPRVVHTFRSYIPGPVQSPLFWIVSQLARFLPSEYAEELKGMADHLHARGISLGELVLINVFYDLFDFAGPDPFLADLMELRSNHTSSRRRSSSGRVPSRKFAPLGCTSVLTADKEGRILHGRNLDYAWTELLKEATILVDFVRNGSVQYTAVQFLLYNGILTGQRAGKFTLSLNARYSGGPWDNLLMELLTRFHHPVSYELRKVLDTVEDYPSAIQALSQMPMIAPAYIIVGGTEPGDGAIISRDRLGPADVYFLDYLHHRWFLVETNDDPWTKSRDIRRKTAEKCLSRIGQRHISPDALFGRVLTVAPVRNSLTVFTTIMSAGRPELIYNHTFIWS